jgi:hypothetical protein
MKLESKLKKWSLSKWKSELDRVFSKWVRTVYSKDGRVACYTCGKIAPIEEMDCGHFNPRQYLETRWDERNCKPQCTHCNRYKNGEPTIFARNLVQEHGQEILHELSKNNFKPIKLDVYWYAQKVEHYEQKLEQLKNS